MKAFRREEGFAMVTAILVSLVVLSLSLVVVNLAVHNSGQSAFDRDRVMAINAAEAGLDNYLSLLKTNPNPPCTSSVDVGATPVEHYDVTVLLYDTWPPTNPGVCPLPTGGPAAGALVTAKGRAYGGPTPGAQDVRRTMETAVQLTPIFGGLNQAIFSNNKLDIQNKLDVNGNIGNDGDVYTNGDFALGNNTIISGSVYAQGLANIAQGVVKADVWANNSVNLTTGISVLGKVTSSTSSISLSNAHVYGDAKAGTTITVPGNSQIDGAQTPNSPSGPPPQIPFPQVPYVQAEWTKIGYTIVNYSNCALAKTFINSEPVGNYVVRISPTCALSWGSSTVNLKGNMAIITDGSFTLSQQNNWNGIGSKHTLFIIRPYQSGLPCTPPTPSPYDINVSNNTSFNNLQVFVYSQCTINFGNNNAGGFDGQIIGGQVNITNQMVVNFKPITVPGFNRIGYRSDVSYLREIPTS
jgi:cytoskeletal protein CcmA (bactofilin family)